MLKQLKELRVSLIMAIQSSDVDAFFVHHRPSAELTSLHLILIGNELTPNAIAHLPEHLATMPQLQSLQLNFYANKLGSDGMTVLSSALKPHSITLKSLQLDLYFNNITETGT